MRPSLGVIGLGRLGSSIAEQLLSTGKVRQLFLHNRSIAKEEGCARSLQILSHILGCNTQVHRLADANLLQADAVIICIKECYDARTLVYTENLPAWLPRNVRTVGLFRDLEGLLMVGRRLRDYAGTIFVVTNPVDVVTTILQRVCPNATVLGLGSSLDSARLAYFLSQETGLKISLEDCPVGGEHGGGTVLLRSLWRGHASKLATASKSVRAALAETLKVGPAIFNDLGYSSHDCTALFAQDVLFALGANPQRTLLVASLDRGRGACGWPLRREGSMRPSLEVQQRLGPGECRSLRRCEAASKELAKRVLEHRKPSE